VHGALDRNPFDREAHEALASTLEPGTEADAALRRALILEPWASEVRDRLMWSCSSSSLSRPRMAHSPTRRCCLTAEMSPLSRWDRSVLGAMTCDGDMPAILSSVYTDKTAFGGCLFLGASRCQPR